MKILIVDDEFTVLTKMEALFSGYGDCSVATNATQAIQLCAAALQEKAPFDLISIDIQLPETNGLDLLTAINKLEAQNQIQAAKKIMVTSSGTKDNLYKAFVKGCDGFIVKPVKRDTLDQKMASLGFSKKGA